MNCFTRLRCPPNILSRTSLCVILLTVKSLICRRSMFRTLMFCIHSPLVLSYPCLAISTSERKNEQSKSLLMRDFSTRMVGCSWMHYIGWSTEHFVQSWDRYHVLYFLTVGHRTLCPLRIPCSLCQPLYHVPVAFTLCVYSVSGVSATCTCICLVCVFIVPSLLSKPCFVHCCCVVCFHSA